MVGSYTQEQLCAQPQQRAKSGFVVTTGRAVYDIEKSIVVPASTLCYNRWHEAHACRLVCKWR
jgi:hypothetical protein